MTGVEAWKDRTSDFDRVRSVASSLSKPRPVPYIADEACVSEDTARDYLESLADMRVLLKSEHEGIITYSPDPLHTRMRSIRELLDDHNKDDFIQRRAELQEQVETWQSEFEVRSPDELRQRAAETGTRNLLHISREWDLVLYRLGVIEDTIENYAKYCRR